MTTDQRLNERLFDGYATTYEDTVNASIAKSGEDVEFFARMKALLVARHLESIGMHAPSGVLDFGCGTGLSTRMLVESLPRGTSVTGIDVSGESIARAHAIGASPGCTFLQYAGETLPFEDATFDVGFAACVFHHVDRSDHVALLRELRRVLRPSGVFFLFEHNPLNPLTVKAVKACPFDDGVTLLPPSYAARTIRQAGFSHTALRYYFFFPRALRALRPLERLLAWIPAGAQYYVAGRR